MEQKYSTVPEALEELRAGKIILVTDDPDRENEGDMICAAEFATCECQFYGYARQGSDLHPYERRRSLPSGPAPDGF